MSSCSNDKKEINILIENNTQMILSAVNADLGSYNCSVGFLGIGGGKSHSGVVIEVPKTVTLNWEEGLKSYTKVISINNEEIKNHDELVFSINEDELVTYKLVSGIN
jgi:hypothetical protein